MKNFTFVFSFKKLLFTFFTLLLSILIQAQVSFKSGGAGQTNISPVNLLNGGDATGLGCGGGGANTFGGNGGKGKFGGGGGGAAGHNESKMKGGSGGNGVIVVASYDGPTLLHTVVYTNGISFTVAPGTTTVSIWAIGAGGGGAGATADKETTGGGGGGGGVAFTTKVVTPGDIITYNIGTGGAGGIDENNGNAGSNTSVTIGSSTITGYAGSGGQYNNETDALGGAYDGDGGAIGGSGRGVKGELGGGGGGGIGNSFSGDPATNDGINGADATDITFSLSLFDHLANAELNEDNGDECTYSENTTGHQACYTVSSFTAITQNQSNMLSWQSSADINMLRYSLQYSTDGLNYSNLYTVPATFGTNEHSYSYIHQNPALGTGYYRLYQVSVSGKNNYGRVLKTTTAAKEEIISEKEIILIGSNIVRNTVKFTLNKNSFVSLYNFNGNIVFTKNMAKGLNEIYINNLARGYYYLKSANDFKKILIQ